MKVSADVVATGFPNGKGVLVDLTSKRCYRINETAFLVWQLLEQGKELDQIATALMETYDVDAEHARRSVGRIVEDFRVRALVTQG